MHVEDTRAGFGVGMSIPSASKVFLIRLRSSRPTSHCFSGIVLIRILITIHQSAKPSTPRISSGPRMNGPQAGSACSAAPMPRSSAMIRSGSSSYETLRSMT